MEKDPYKILKVQEDASAVEIERAYHKCMLNYGFDPRVTYTEEERDQINKMTSEIKEAYQSLTGTDPEQTQEKEEPDHMESPETLELEQPEVEQEMSDIQSEVEIPLEMVDEEPYTEPEEEFFKEGFMEEEPAESQEDVPGAAGGSDLSSSGVYNQHFGLMESPFGLTPDTKYFYLSSKHKEALAHLFFGLQEQKGFVIITGEVGTGKTTLCRSFLTQLDSSVRVAYIFNPCLSDIELLQNINAEFGLPSRSESKTELIDDFNRFLLEARQKKKKVVLVIDEAQDLETGTLEQLRLLSNLETEAEKLLNIALVGQPELLDTLRDHGLRQLEQRISVRWNLSPLDYNETQNYIQHRLKIARSWGKVQFTNGAFRKIYKASKGVPRMINILSDGALMVAYTLGRKSINRRIASLAVANHFQNIHPAAKPFPRGAGMVLTLVLALFFSLYIGPWGVQYFKSLKVGGLVSMTDKEAPSEKEESPAKKPASASPDKEAKKTPVEEKPKILKKVEKNEQAAPKVPPPKPEKPKIETPATKPEKKTKGADSELLKTLKQQTMEQSQLQAFNNLMEVWKVPPISEVERKDSLSESIHDRGLGLFAFEGNVDKIMDINHPIILELKFEEGKRYLSLNGISHQYIYTDGEKKKKIPLEKVKQYWSGTGFILMKEFEKLNYNLKMKDKGPQIKWLQKGLAKLGFFKEKQTGYFGKVTKKAVIKFQKFYNLYQDGIVGPEMKMKLYKLLDYPVPSIVVKE